jgi:hypothetical protein
MTNAPGRWEIEPCSRDINHYLIEGSRMKHRYMSVLIIVGALFVGMVAIDGARALQKAPIQGSRI